MTAFHNLLEPVSLLVHFQEQPPAGFETLRLPGGSPGFTTLFDVLTTIEPKVRARIERVASWSPRLRSLLRLPTAFLGTTVTEYAPLPVSHQAESLVREVIASWTPGHQLVIIKDLPMEAILAGDAAHAHSRAVAAACRASGFVLVEGQALAYVPIDFASIDELLSRLSHARRKNLRRKLKSRAALQIDTIPAGDPRFFDDALLETLYQLYRNVYDQSEIHFDLLTPSFFRAVLQDGASNGVIFTYAVDGALIGYNVCFLHEGLLLDKYIGLAYPAARKHNLYMVSWMHNLEYALAHGARAYVAGWTDPAVKRSLGARFTWTQHAVYVRHPVLRALLRLARPLFEADTQWKKNNDARADS